ncbi:MAG TPA: RNA-binding transcriptional accessory protein [Eubacteriaceae bacterium]|nr:RNA-binding transcriptional accessory protein [Eubacteriaceae bacterium]
MNAKIVNRLSNELNIKSSQAEAAVRLIDEGNTIPFIARYRKEATGNLDDVILRDLDERLNYLRNLEKRKEEVIRLIEEQGKLTEELKKNIIEATIMQEVEDYYLPYKQKRKTRASKAKEKGLEPLYLFLRSFSETNEQVEEKAKDYIDEEKEVFSQEEAVQGAVDILAEEIAEDIRYRQKIRELFAQNGLISSSKTKTEDEKANDFEMYFDYEEKVKTIPNHRVLALNRGEKKKFLSVKVRIDEERATKQILEAFLEGRKTYPKFLEESVADGLKRLMIPSIEREVRSTLTEKADKSAINVFAANLKQYLMQPPVTQKTVMGFDPAYRTGCKIAVVDPYGKVLDTATVYPTAPQNKVKEAEEVLLSFIKKHGVHLIAIGNGTASRESEIFVSELIEKKGLSLAYLIANEAGASVYSASKIGTEELPQYNVSLRGAVSIARRIQDPLAELVKIDPKHIGVGQYQHDVNQKDLEKALADVIEDCVNSVGVDLNTASRFLLTHIAGLNGTTAKNIEKYKEENGPFRSRRELLKVPKIGKKAFEQCAGFLRIAGGDNPLDNSALHPESYEAAKWLIDRAGLTIDDFSKKQDDFAKALEKINLKKATEALDIGSITVAEIIKELKKPARDPRDSFPKPEFKTGVMDMDSLEAGMILKGTVRNILDFGVFVDIGVHQDGLVHISQLSNRFVKHPMDVVSVGDGVSVRVLDVDRKRNRISLSMKTEE